MSWHEDLEIVTWDGDRYAVLDRITERGRRWLGLSAYARVSAAATALDAGAPGLLDLVWVEALGDGFRPLSPAQRDQVLAYKRDRAAQAFGKARP